MIKTIKNFFSDNILNDSAFRIVYFTNLFLNSIAILDIVSVFVDALIFLWSIFIFADKIKRKVLKVKYFNLILLFILFSLITAVINIKIGFPINFIANLGMIYNTVICFFIFYGMYMDKSFNNIKNESILLFKIIITLTTFFTIVSFIMILMCDSFSFGWDMPIIVRYEHVLGIVKGTNSFRFTGVYTNPNIVAFCSIVSIIFCHMLYRSSEFFKNKSKAIRLFFLVLLISINLTAIILSDSIASFLFLVIYFVFWIFYKLIVENKNFSIKSILKKGIVFFIASVALIFGLFTIRSDFQSGASNVIDEIYSIISNSKAEVNLDENVHFGRQNHDIRDGSGRSRLLKQAFIIFSKHPILGIGNTNIVDYGKIYFEEGIAFPNFHNGYVSILVCNGIIGFLIFMTFLTLVLFELVRFLFNCSKNLGYNIFPNLLVAILSYLIFALFEKTIFSEVNYMSLFFWLILGYAVSFLYNNQDNFIKN